MIKRTGVCLLAGVALLGGCGTSSWVHPDYGTERLQGDLDECSRIAQDQARRLAGVQSGPAMSQVRRGPGGGVVGFEPLNQPNTVSDFQEGQALNSCMRAKGYRASSTSTDAN